MNQPMRGIILMCSRGGFRGTSNNCVGEQKINFSELNLKQFLLSYTGALRALNPPLLVRVFNNVTPS